MSRLPKRERISRLQSVIVERHMVPVAELQDLMEVSRMTLHRDLGVLEKQGIIEKLHGSVRVKNEPYNYNIDASMSLNIEAKREIARKAATYINEHDTLFMGTGTSILELGRLITESDLAVTIVTGSIPVANLCQNSRNTRLIMTGGDYHRRTLSLIGELSRNSLEILTGSILFMSANYVDLQGGFTTTFNQIAELHRLMHSRCKLTIALMDSSKFGKVNVHHVYDVDGVDVIITDSQIDPEIYQTWREAGVNLVRADE